MSNTRKVNHVRTSFKGSKSLTEQHHKSEVKIQNIMKKHQATGLITHTSQYAGEYSNMVNAPDFMEAQLVIAEAKSMFESVPAHIRKEFANDPAQFLKFMQDEENREKIEAFGLDTTHLPEQMDIEDAPPVDSENLSESSDDSE